jgi:glutathione S-transferase
MGSSQVTLFGHWICPYSIRVQFALGQRDISYSMVDVPPRAVRPKDFVVPSEFIEHSPKLEVPMVRCGTEYLADSIPILEWLEELVPLNSLLPTQGEDRHLVRQRVQWLDKYLYRPMIGVYYGTDTAKIAIASDAVGNALVEISTWLQDSQWLAGTQPTTAEAIMVGFYTRIDGLRELGLTAPIPIEVAAHIERCKQLQGWGHVEWSAEQTDEFVGRFQKYREIQNARS